MVLLRLASGCMYASVITLFVILDVQLCGLDSLSSTQGFCACKYHTCLS